jgi:hypothetical protein
LSKIEEILEDLTKYFISTEKYTRIFYDDSLMDPNNTQLPALSYKVGEMKQETPSGCNEYLKELEIRRHTGTLNKRELLTELWDFEEEIITLIREGMKSGELYTRHEIDLEYLKTYPIGALVYTPPETDKKTFFCNILRVAFKLRYVI